MNIKKQLVKLYLYEIFISLRITDAVWVIFLLSRGFSLAQVGIAEGVFHITGFLCEIPTGMAADLLGRKYTLAFSGVCGAISAVLMACSFGFVGVCLSMVFNALMYNLMSGTLEAVAYDSLVSVNKSEAYLRVSAWMGGLSRTIAALGCLAGGVAALLGYFKAYMVSAVISAAVVVLALSLTEPLVTRAQQQRAAHPFAGLGQRLWKHIYDSFSFLAHNPRTACKILADAAVATPIYLTFMLLQQHLTANGLPALYLGAALLLIRMAGTGGVAIGARCKKRYFSIAVFCIIGAGFGTVLAGVRFWPLAVLGAVLAQLAEGLMQLRTEVSLNNDFPSDQRATLISVDSMVYSMLMIAASPVAGAVGDAFGTSAALYLLGGFLLLVGVLGAFVYKKIFVKS